MPWLIVFQILIDDVLAMNEIDLFPGSQKDSLFFVPYKPKGELPLNEVLILNEGLEVQSGSLGNAFVDEFLLRLGLVGEVALGYLFLDLEHLNRRLEDAEMLSIFV